MGLATMQRSTAIPRLRATISNTPGAYRTAKRVSASVILAPRESISATLRARPTKERPVHGGDDGDGKHDPGYCKCKVSHHRFAPPSAAPPGPAARPRDRSGPSQT